MEAELFEVLKSVLKARGMTYAELGDRMGLSEPTIKRVFAERDCKLSRIAEICGILGVTLDDLVSEVVQADVSPHVLTDGVEAKLAADSAAFGLFLLLLDGMTAATILDQYEFDAHKFFELGLRLEKLGLVAVMPGNRLRLTISGPVQFRRGGPLHQKLLKLNMDFVRRTYLAQQTDQSAFLTQSRRMSPKTANRILSRIRDLQAELATLARRDQLTQPNEALRTYKVVIALSPVDLSDMLSLQDQ